MATIHHAKINASGSGHTGWIEDERAAQALEDCELRVEFALDIGESVTLGVDRAIPCAMIVHELVVNGFKHAFPGDGWHCPLMAASTGLQAEGRSMRAAA